MTTSNPQALGSEEHVSASLRPLPLSRLSCHGIIKRWPRTQRAVLDRVELDLQPAEFVSLVGRNGIGKTTLLRIAAGLIWPDAGEVRVDGLHPRRDRRRYQRRVGFLSAGSGGLYARFTTRQQLDYCARLAFVPRSHRLGAVQHAIARFALEDMSDKRLDRISMGQRQRVRLAMTFLHEPVLALLDEPWNSLDDDGATLLHGVFEEFVARGGTVLCCTPSADEHAVADRTYVLEDGLVRLA